MQSTAEEGSYQVRLQRAIVQLRNEYFDSEAGRDNGAQCCGSEQCEWDLQKLPLHALGRREDSSHFAGGFIADLFLGLELATRRLDGGDTFGLPPTAQINLLTLPVFDEDDAPEAVDRRVDNRVTAQEEPAGETKRSRENQEPEVGLQEGKVEPDLRFC